MKRRDFVQKASLALASTSLATYLSPPFADPLEIHLFSKHLQFLDYEEMAATAKAIGFDGVELTVRPRGHVEPEQAKTELPKALAAIQANGLRATMIVTAFTEINDLSTEVLQIAAENGIKYYRLGYYRYPKTGTLPNALEKFKKQYSQLAELNEKLGLTGVYQNHAGSVVGASMWEIWQLLERISPKAMGCQYDIRHAMVEGGGSWRNGLRLIESRISSLVAKDFIWSKRENGWEIVNVPIGEGMVKWIDYFTRLKQYQINVPLTVHYEYDMGGAEHGDRELNGWTKADVASAMQRDLHRIRQAWLQADPAD